MSGYPESYYKTVNYSDYMERSERYHKLAAELSNLLKSISLLRKESVILDFGCAVGHLMTGFINLGYDRCIGVESSDWAIDYCVSKGLNVVTLDKISALPDIVFALDVFEHMGDLDILNFLNYIDNAPMVIRIPVASKIGGDFHLEVSRNDPTHINCKTKDRWVELLSKTRNRIVLPLDLNTIYDSAGVFSAILL